LIGFAVALVVTFSCAAGLEPGSAQRLTIVQTAEHSNRSVDEVEAVLSANKAGRRADDPSGVP
jgi:hypothetical protein